MLKKILLTVVLIGFCVRFEGIEISSHHPIEYNDISGELIANGEAKIIVGNTVIRANEIRFHKEQSLVIASGNVSVETGGFYVIADSISYDLSKNLLHAINGKVKNGNYYFFVENFEYNDGFTFGSNAKMFPCEPGGIFDPSLDVKKFEVSNEKVCSLENVKVEIGKFPIFFLPRSEVRLNKKPFFLDSKVGTSHSKGAFWQNNFYFGIRKGLKLGGLFDIYTKRGILVGPAMKFRSQSENNSIYLKSKFGYIKDNASADTRGKDIRNHQISKDRYLWKFAYKQHHGDKIDVIANTTLLSDSEVERDFRKSWHDKNRRQDSFIEAVYRQQNYIVSAFGRFEPNNFYSTTNRLPELRFDHLPTKFLDSKFIHHGHASLSRIRGKDFTNLDKVSSYRADLYYGLSLPMSDGEFISIRPMTGIRWLLYNHNVVNKGSHGKALIQAGCDIDMKFVGYSDYTNPIFGINGLKHAITGSLQYRIIPSSGLSSNIPIFDSEVFSTEMPPINLEDMRNVDTIKEQNMIRLGLRNNLSTRSESYIPRQLFRFDIFQDILFKRNYLDYDRSQKQKCFPDTYLIAGVYPAPWLSFDAYSRIDPSKLKLHELRTSMSITDGDFWKLSFTTRYLNPNKKITEEYGLKFSFNLSSRTSVSFEEIYDARIKKFSKQRISLSTIACNSWKVNLGVTVRENAKREDRFQFEWSIKLADF